MEIKASRKQKNSSSLSFGPDSLSLQGIGKFDVQTWEEQICHKTTQKDVANVYAKIPNIVTLRKFDCTAPKPINKRLRLCFEVLRVKIYYLVFAVIHSSIFSKNIADVFLPAKLPSFWVSLTIN